MLWYCHRYHNVWSYIRFNSISKKTQNYTRFELNTWPVWSSECVCVLQLFTQSEEGKCREKRKIKSIHFLSFYMADGKCNCILNDQLTIHAASAAAAIAIFNRIAWIHKVSLPRIDAYSNYGFAPRRLFIYMNHYETTENVIEHSNCARCLFWQRFFSAFE